MTLPEFIPFTKIPRLNREIVITEKIDGTNACIKIPENPEEPLLAGSRNGWLHSRDNYGFNSWVQANNSELRKLGPGVHFGEWWGCGINRQYDFSARHFSLFNVQRWGGIRLPDCVEVVPVLYRGVFSSDWIDFALDTLRMNGSAAMPGFKNPEGIVIFHYASQQLYKVTLDNDAQPKSKIAS